MKKEEKREKTIHSIYLVSALVVLGVIIVTGFFIYKYYKSPVCDDSDCFFEKLSLCEKAIYTNYGNLTFEYKIKELENEKCKVKVELVRSFWREKEFKSLEGREMVCYLEFGKTVYPEQELDSCIGFLKEGLQEMIIQRLHKYILDNLGTSV